MSPHRDTALTKPQSESEPNEETIDCELLAMWLLASLLRQQGNS